jgi:dTDP-4-amino-4,6-dideoxygalactose transaminase
MLPTREALAAGLETLYQSRILTNQGVHVRALEAKIAEQLGVKHCALFCNATIAIMVLLRALDLDGEIIVPSFTFAATVQSVLWERLRPKFVDIGRPSLLLDPGLVEAAVTKTTSAIFGVNLFGSCCDHDRLRKIARRHGLPLIYDSAQAFGTRYKGKMVGALGDAEVFSFHATKLFHTGEGGAIVTNDSGLHARVCRMRNFGFASYLNCVDIGLNGKMSELAAIVGLGLLKDLPLQIEKRRRLFQDYRERLGSIPGLDLPPENKDVSNNCSYFYVLVDPARFGLTSLELNLALLYDRIVTRCYFYPPVHRTSYFQTCPRLRPQRGSWKLPVTDWAAQRVLCLPAHTDMPADELAKIGAAIARCRAHAPEIRARAAGKLPKKWAALRQHAADPYEELILAAS